jgi:hypothetical protein
MPNSQKKPSIWDLARKKNNPSTSTTRFYSSPLNPSNSSSTRRSANIAVDRPDPSSSRATVNGQAVVLDSDAEDDSDGDLVDLNDLLNLPRRKSSTTSTVKPKNSKEDEEKKRNDAKEAMAKLLKSTEAQRAEEKRVEELQAKLEMDMSMVEHGDIMEMDEEQIKRIMARGGTEEQLAKAKKMMEAMKRTEIMEVRPVWYLFNHEESVGNTKRLGSQSWIPKEEWAAPFRGEFVTVF